MNNSEKDLQPSQEELRAYIDEDGLSGFQTDVGENVKKNFLRELVSSPKKLMAFYGALSVAGYFVSLLICAQNSVGLSHFSHRVAGALHTIPGALCPLVCGFVFTAIPFLFAALFLNRFQHRYLLFRLWWFIAGVPVFTTLLMLFFPAPLQHSNIVDASAVGHISETAWLSIWAVSAIATPYLLELFVYLMIRQRKYAKVPHEVK